jgi:hypothetical protein
MTVSDVGRIKTEAADQAFGHTQRCGDLGPLRFTRPAR